MFMYFLVASHTLWGQPQTAQKNRASQLYPQMYLQKEVVHLRMQLNSCTWVPALNMQNSRNLWRTMTQTTVLPIHFSYGKGILFWQNSSQAAGLYFKDAILKITEQLLSWKAPLSFPSKTQTGALIKYLASVLLEVLSALCLEIQQFTFSSFQGSYISSFYHTIKNEKANPLYFTAFFHAVWLDLYDPSYLWSQAHSSTAIKNL